VEPGVAESEVAQLAEDGLLQLAGHGSARGGQRSRGSAQPRFERGQRAVDLREPFAARVQVREAGFRRFAERQDVRDAAAVLASELLHERHARLERGEPFGRRVDVADPVVDRSRQFLDLDRDATRLVVPDARRFAHDARHVGQRVLDRPQLVQHRGVAFGQSLRNLLAQRQQLLRVGGVAMGLDQRVAVRFGQGRVADFADLEAEHVRLARGVGVVAGELAPPGEQALLFLVEGRVGRQLVRVATEGVQDLELERRIEQRLVVVGAVQVDEQRPDAAQGLDRRGCVVDEVAPRPRGRNDPADDERAVLAGGQARVAQQRVERSRVGRPDHGLDHALWSPGSHERAVRAAAGEQVDRPDQHGLARTGLARDDVQALLERHRDVVDDGEILDSKAFDHGGRRFRRL